MPTNDFVPFATGTGANVYSTASYQASNARLLGVVDGEADPKLANNAWRQPSVVGAMIGSFIASQGFDALDDGNIANLLANFAAALDKSVGSQFPSRQRIHYGSDTGVANRIVANVSPDITAYEAGAIYWVLAANAPTGAAVANLDGRGDRNIVRRDGTAIQANDWVAGEIIELRDDGSRLQLASGQSGSVVQTQITTTFNTLAITGGRTTVFSTPGSFTWMAPEGASRARVIAVGGGGGGGGAANNGAGAGGGGGGYVEGTVVVVAGQIYGGLVGAGGARGQASGQAATPGGTSSFTAGGATLSATGGGGGGFGNGTSVGITGAGGGGVGGDLSFAGSTGQNGIYIPTGTGNNVLFGGMGGGSRYAPTTPFPYGGGNVSGSGPGGAGSGGAGSGDGGAGFPGIVIIMA